MKYNLSKNPKCLGSEIGYLEPNKNQTVHIATLLFNREHVTDNPLPQAFGVFMEEKCHISFDQVLEKGWKTRGGLVI